MTSIIGDRLQGTFT